MCLPFRHQWELKDTQEITRTSNITNKVVAIWQVHTLICKKCGTVKAKKINMSNPL